MGGYNIYDWQKSIHATNRQAGDDDDTQSVYSDQEESSRRWEQKNTQAKLEGKNMCFDDSSSTTDYGNPYAGLSRNTIVSDPNKIWTLADQDWQENAAPQNPKPHHSDAVYPTKLPNITQDLHYDGNSIISGSSRRRNQAGAPRLDNRSISGSPDGAGQNIPSLTPSDFAYRPSWLAPERSRIGAATEKSYVEQLYESPHSQTRDYLHQQGLALEFRAQPQLKTPAMATGTADNRSTLSPNDSASNVKAFDHVELERGFHTAPFNNPREAPKPPVNRRTAWLHIVGGFFVAFNCLGMPLMFGLFQDFYASVFIQDSSLSNISWIGGTQLALVMGLGWPVGKLVEKGYFRIVFHAGMVVMIGGMIAAAWCRSLVLLWLVQGLMTGVGMGIVFCCGVAALTSWLVETDSDMPIALCASGSSVGAIAYLLIARTLLMTHGFKITMLVLAGVAAATMIPPSIILRIRSQARRDVRRGHSTSRITPPADPSLPTTSKGSLTLPYFLLLLPALLLTNLAFPILPTYTATYATTTLHLLPTDATDLLLFLLIASLPGHVVAAFAGTQNSSIVSALLGSAAIWLWAGMQQDRSSFTLVVCCYGFFSAGMVQGPLGMAKGNDGELRGGWKAGLAGACAGVGGLVGLPIAGALVSCEAGMAKPYLLVQIFSGVSLALGGLLLFSKLVAKARHSSR